MAIYANVRNKQIYRGKIIYALVQGEHASENIIFRILGEPELLSDFDSTYFYLLYTRPVDSRPNVVLLTNKTKQDDVIEVTFKPTSFFTAHDGTVKIQIMATDTEGLSVDSETGTISGSTIWQTFPSAMFVHESQLTGTETIIEENVLTQYLAGMQELHSSTEQAAEGAEAAAGDAGESAEAAAGSASDASRDAASASASATLAGKWAEEAVDTPVETGKYSAKHWAAKAKESADAAAASKEELDDYVEETIKPALDAYEEDLEDDLDSHTADKKDELDTYEGAKETELNTYTGTKKSELDTHTGTKKTELDTYVTNTEKPALDTYTNAKKAELDTYEAAKEAALDTYKTAKEGEIDSYVAETSKPSIDDYIEDEKKPEIDAYIEQQAAQYDATAFRDGISALDKRVSNLEESLDVITEIEYPDATYGTGEVPPNKSKYAEVSVLEGVGRGANQLADNPTFDVKGDWTDFLHASTVTVSNNVLTAVENNSNDRVGFGRYLRTAANHSYLCLIRIDSATSGLTLEGGIRNFLKTVSVGFNALVITTNANSTEVGVASTVGISGATVSCSLFNVKDLNTYFNTTDLSFLGATDSAKLATIQQKYPELLVPSDYGTEVVFPTYTAVKSKGVNLFDEEWEVGSINNTTGQNESASSTWRGVNYISVTPNVTYYFKSSGLSLRFYWYDADKNFISSNTIIDSELTAPNNAWYLRIRDVTAGGPTYANNVQVCDNSLPSAVKTTYHPYMTDTLTLPEPITPKGAGSVADTDELNVKVDGVRKRRKTQRIGSVDLSTLTWSYNSGWNCWQGTVPSDIALPSSTTVVVNALWAGMVAVRSSGFTTQSNVGTFAINQNGIFFVNNGSSTVAPTGTMYYELADPVVTLSDPIPDNLVKTEPGGRVEAVTESPVDTRFVMTYVNKISA